MYESSVRGELPFLAVAELPVTPEGTLAEIREDLRLLRVVEGRLMALNAHFATQYGRSAGSAVLPGTEGNVQPAGPGTPSVGEFASLELALALETDDQDAAARMYAAMRLKYKFPKVWSMVRLGEAEAWKASTLCGLCDPLTAEQCSDIDAEVATRIRTTPFTRLRKLVDGLVLQLLPRDEAEKIAEEAKEQRGFWVDHRRGGVSSVASIMNSADAVAVESQVRRLAVVLREMGEKGTPDALRARALGILGSNPALALSMLQAAITDQLPLDSDAWSCPDAEAPGHLCGQVTVDPEKLLPRAQVVVHLTDTTLANGDGPARPEGMPAFLAQWCKDLLENHRVAVKPVIDIPGMAPCDSYEIPERMREAVSFRSPFSAFPFSARRSRSLGGGEDEPVTLDLDHTDPYRPRHSGQTRVDNLAPLTRRQHRAKTHGGWQCEQIASGITVWRSPLGQVAVNTPSGSWRLHSPTSWELDLEFQQLLAYEEQRSRSGPPILVDPEPPPSWSGSEPEPPAWLDDEPDPYSERVLELILAS